MLSLSARVARQRFSSMLKRAEAGEQIAITRHGDVVAVLGAPRRGGSCLPPQAAFRSAIHVRGGALSDTVSRLRDEE